MKKPFSDYSAIQGKNVTIKDRFRKTLSVLAVALLILVFLSWTELSAPILKFFGLSDETIIKVQKAAQRMTTGTALILAGLVTAALVVPFAPIVGVVVAIGLIATGVLMLYSAFTPSKKFIPLGNSGGINPNEGL